MPAETLGDVMLTVAARTPLGDEPQRVGGARHARRARVLADPAVGASVPPACRENFLYSIKGPWFAREILGVQFGRRFAARPRVR